MYCHLIKVLFGVFFLIVPIGIVLEFWQPLSSSWESLGRPSGILDIVVILNLCDRVCRGFKGIFEAIKNCHRFLQRSLKTIISFQVLSNENMSFTIK